MTLKEIEARLLAIAEEIKVEGADVDALSRETNELIEKRTALLENEEKRSKMLKDIANQNLGISIRSFRSPEEKKEVMDYVDTPEYRSAFLKSLLNIPLDEAEQRAFVHTTENTGAVVPTELQNKIYSNMAEQHPILRDIQLLRTGVVISIVKHTTIVAGDAKNVAEATANDDEQNTFVNVTLTGKDISKHIDFSYRLGKLSIPAFEAYLINEIGERIGRQWAINIIAQIKSDLNAGNKLNAKTPGTFAKIDALTALSKLKGVGQVFVYANSSSIYLNIATMADAGNLISFIPNYQDAIAGQLYGKGIKQEDALADGEILFLDPKQYIENVVQDILIERDKNIKTHVHTIAGIAITQGSMTNDQAGALVTVGTGV